jgi:DNA-binding NtrC family response regulator
MTPNTLASSDTEPETPQSAASRASLSSLGFVVVWTSHAQEHVGAWLAVNPDGDRCQLLGRGEAQPEDEHPRLQPIRQRPGESTLLEAFSNPSLSRRQLLLQSTPSGSLALESVGRCRMSLNGVELSRGEARPGDVLEIGSQLVLYCAERPLRLEGSQAPAAHAFGASNVRGFVGESPLAWRSMSDLELIAPRSGHVLVIGPTGTGKELVSSALHASSGRSGPLVARNAATIPDTLVDAELFGNVKDYPNPGMPDRKGLIGAADGGSLFLDEFAELPPSAQAHLLRVLDAGEYQRLGETTPRRSRFRLIAATNREESALRPDVLARFDFQLKLPSLDERREDIPFIVQHLFDKMRADAPALCERFSDARGAARLGRGFVVALMRHVFTRNVRELRSMLWSALHESHGPNLEWPASIDARATSMVGSTPPPAADELDVIRQVLTKNSGSIEKSWRELGLSSRYALTRLLRKHGISLSRQPDPR